MKKETCCIIGAGSFSAEELCIEAGSFIIAADGGYQALTDAGIIPDLVVGDFDSLGTVPNHPNVIQHPVEKDDTDMMLAIKTAFELGYERFRIFGGLGGRLDHTFANLQALSYIAAHGGRGYLIGENTVITAITNGGIHFTESAKGCISVFAHGKNCDGVYITGFKYTLENSPLSAFNPLGVSNEFIGVRSTVSVRDGMLIIMWNGTVDDVEPSVLPAFDAAIFDMDGTLLDSMPIWENLGREYLTNHGIAPRPDLRERIRKMSLLQTADYFISDYGLELTQDEIMAGLNAMVEDFYLYEAPAKAGVRDFLTSLKEAGIPLCVATATDRYLVEPALRRNGLLDFFDFILTCTEVGAGKNTPDIYFKAAEMLGSAPSSAMVFEDARYAARTAKGAGFPLAVCYDASADRDRPGIDALADVRICRFADVRLTIK